MNEVDAVVIGSGPNGLVAATLLADAGWDVLVLEQRETPGGAVTSAEITAPGFTNDVYSAFYPLGLGSPVIGALNLDVQWQHAPAVLAHVLPDDRVALLSRDVDVTAKSVGSFAHSDAEAWQAEYARWQQVRGAVLESLLRPFPPVRGGLSLLRTLGAGDALRLVRLLTLPVRRLGEELFAGEGARLLLAGNTMHSDLGPDQAGGAGFGWLLAMLAQEVGNPVPRGGAGELTASLVRRFGGRIETGARVTEVLHARGVAVGVRLADGSVVRARRAVLADVPAPRLYLDLIGGDALPSKLAEDLKRFQWDGDTIKVDWALSGPIPWRNAEASQAGTVHLGGDLNGLAGVAHELACGKVPRNPFMILGQMTTTDPTRSPAGTEAAWAYTHVPLGGNWTPDRLKRRADRLELMIEERAPGFRSRILGRSVLGPADIGSVNGGTAAIHQQLVFRPVPGLGRADTPFDRLYLTGSSAWPGGGVHGAAGANAARAALARWGVAGGLYRALVQGAQKAIY
ncbi:NAD(P)/FAD-dependent oxidoreductase [Lentzea sp. BCCO 10_0798]|uniref:Pyridine nucleotide-disulfide oxidoreductase domain-containing protein 2 n=1 Tax=Lentzea kristufekii TaxID=3095430 RepID=A0ABU4TXV5_9PSEU|nr:NAD(P)/FAD-dependent oxidoreductase [Lentzea sp. BCCO 10_0798]MDX8053136.1 NAD(P)/FAD-dependent oxidoreductase [Lentzea sp. BCCO 10_0798]